LISRLASIFINVDTFFPSQLTRAMKKMRAALKTLDPSGASKTATDFG
jgi:hypothetical protein